MHDPKAFDPAVYVALASNALELDINPEYLPGIVANIALLRSMSNLVMDFPLSDHDELGPVFNP